jgi:hypothetical protein
LTNEDVINKLEKHRRAEAQALFSRFARAFNLGLPKVENLYECEPNPFIGGDGELDLSGRRLGRGEKLSLKSPLNFSLPSMLQGQNEAPGLCTIQLLNLMAQLQNRLVDAAKKASALRGPAGQPDDTREVTALPVTHFQIPSALLQRQLVAYDRGADLLPLISAFAFHPPGAGALSFDLNGIEQALLRSMMRGRSAVNLHVRQFTFMGEVRQAGRLSALSLHIQQEELPVTVREAITKELDTAERITRLQNLVEDAINFLARLGGTQVGGADGAMLLHKYTTEVLLLGESQWKQSVTATIEREIRLCHLRALFLCLEGISGGLEHRVDGRYKEELPAELQAELTNAAKHIDLPFLVPILRDFLSEKLNTSMNPDFGLKARACSDPRATSCVVGVPGRSKRCVTAHDAVLPRVCAGVPSLRQRRARGKELVEIRSRCAQAQAWMCRLQAPEQLRIVRVGDAIRTVM